MRVPNKKYSKIYKVGNRSFRYNHFEGMIEYVSKEKFNHNTLEFEPTEQWNEIDSMGLSVDDWNDGQEYWCEVFNDDLDSQMEWEIMEFREAFGY